MILDFAVIGAGPAGSFLAKKLCQSGCEAAVFEEHEKVGFPVHCTGLLTKKIEDYVSIPNEVITNHINSVRIHSETKSSSAASDELVVDRQKFDEFLKKEAENAGADYYTNHKLIGYDEIDNSLIFQTGDGLKKYKARTIIGCDGPLSKVNELFSMNESQTFFFGKQILVKSPRIDVSSYDVFFNSGFNDFFGWSVPSDGDYLKVGVGSLNNPAVNAKLEKLCRMLKIKSKPAAINAGLIPLYNPFRVIYKKHNGIPVYLMGDAAGFVKATSGGGIIPSFRAAKECYKDIIRGVSPKLSETRRELLAHLMLRKVMNKLGNNEWDELVSELNDDSVKNAVSNVSRDDIARLIFELIAKKPLLLKYLKHAWKLAAVKF